MKKVAAILTAIVLFFATSSFAAGPETATETVKLAFKKDFSNALNIAWEKTGDLYTVNFLLSDINMTVSYTGKGDIVRTSRVIPLEKLPAGLSQKIADKYMGYELEKNVTEVTSEGHTDYYFGAENKKHHLIIKSDISGNAGVESKTRK